MNTNARLFSIQPTSYGGRGVYAQRDITAGTCILRCPAPYAYVIARKFRKEVCAWCFNYAFEHGKNTWKWKYETTSPARSHEPTAKGQKTGTEKKKEEDDYANFAGLWFCSAECRAQWYLEIDVGGLHAALMGTLEKLRVSNRKRGPAGIPLAAAGSVSNEKNSFPLLKNLQRYWVHSADALLAASSCADLYIINSSDKEPIVGSPLALSVREELDVAWRHAELVYPPKGHGKPRELHQEDALSEFELDTARFVISALVRRFQEESITAQAGWPNVTWSDMLELQNNEVETALRKPDILASHLRVYGCVRGVIETVVKVSDAKINDINSWSKLRTFVDKSDHVRAVLARDHGNAFGIWDTSSQSDSEMLGWGLYVEGSYFNHDCSPNIKKERVGRTLEFYVMRNIIAGEELCTTYIDVDDPTLQRRSELKEQWYFDCACARCHEELNACTSHKRVIDSGYVSSIEV